MADLLASLPVPTGSPRYDTVLYLGAGDIDIPVPASPSVQHLLLVEGDKETAAELQRRWPEAGPVEVIAAAVAPDDGALAWHRYSLPTLNGPVDHLPLTRVYPRLRLLDQQALAARSLRSLVHEKVPAAALDATPARALLVDLPGQEQALLASLDAQTVQRFDVVVVRSAEPTPALTAAGFKLQHTDHEASPLWPVRVYGFDRVRHELQTLRAALEAAHERRLSLKAELRQANESTAQAQRQVQAADVAVRQKADALAQVQAREARLDERLQEQARTIEALRAEGATSGQELGRVQKLLTAAQEQLVESRLMLQQVRGEFDQVNQEAEALRRQLGQSAPRSELERLQQRTLELARQLEAAQGERVSLREQLRAAQAQHDAAQAALAAEAAAAWPQRHAALEREHASLRQAQTQQQVQLRQVQEELLKAEGQLDMIKGLLLAGQGL